MITKNVRKAVFPVAGWGTRFLPVTKTIPKELIPILNKPLIQYAAEEAIEAGIDTLIFITGRNKRAIEDHFDANKELEDVLEKNGKSEEVNDLLNVLPSGVECIFVRQKEQLGLGHAVSCAERIIGDEPFAVLLADDFLPSKSINVTIDLIKGYNVSGNIQLAVMEVNGPDISNYGVIKLDESLGKVEALVEKPDFSKAPSNLASIGRYVLTPDIFRVLKNLPVGKNREIQLADAISVLCAEGSVEIVGMKSKRFDCGSVKGYLEANLFVGKQKGWL